MAGAEFDSYLSDPALAGSQDSQVLEFALAAIAARINGELDNPNLRVFGPVSADPRQDIRQIIHDVRRAVGQENMDSLPPEVAVTRMYPFAVSNPVIPPEDGVLP